jgi:ATP-dependent DNA helicase RecG
VKQGEFLPNVACALLFAKDPTMLFAGCKVRCLRYAGEFEQTGKNYNVVKDYSAEGTIPEIIDDTAKWLRDQLRDFSHLADDGKFYTAGEFSPSRSLNFPDSDHPIFLIPISIFREADQ